MYITLSQKKTVFFTQLIFINTALMRSPNDPLHTLLLWVPQLGAKKKVWEDLFFRSLYQLIVNGWFGLVVWDSTGTPKTPNPFHKGIPGIQTTNPKPTTNH